MRARDIPNIITVCRIASAIPLLWFLLNQQWKWSLLLVFVAGLSDALDGYLAKQFDWQSELGGILDPIADKVLLLICFSGLWWSADFPAWLFALMLLRDVLIVSGAVTWWRLHNKKFVASPSFISKITTTLQIFLAALYLTSLAFAMQVDRVLGILIVAVALFTAISGVDYVWRYGRLAWRIQKEKQ
jgi:cardiolipin synthase (CMP-forming)